MEVNKLDLRKILIDVFPASAIPAEIQELKMNDFEEWDSLGNFNLLLSVESFYKISFDIEAMSSIKSVESLLKHLESLNK